jgi:hypothetical protein
MGPVESPISVIHFLWLRGNKLANKSFTNCEHKVNANTEYNVSKSVPHSVYNPVKGDISTFGHTLYRVLSMKYKTCHC